MSEPADLARFPVRPVEERSSVLVTEEHGAWTGQRLLEQAASLAGQMPETAGALVGVCSSSPGFILAAALAAWARRVEPLVLDPNLKSELAAPGTVQPGLSILADSAGSELGGAVAGAPAVAGVALDPLWPSGRQAVARFLTSGSTGEPKVVVKRAEQLMAQLERELPWLGIGRGVKVFAMVPPFHILGFVYGLLTPLLSGGSTCFLHHAAPAAWADHIRRERPQVVVGVPSHYRFLVQSLDGPLPDALYLSSGAPLTPDVDEAFRSAAGRFITQIYGSTETGGVARREGFGGWTPFPGLDWRIRPEDGRLTVRSSWQLDPRGWTVTDDLARADDRGGFILEGRADSIVKVGGKRFSTNEILKETERLPEVASAVTVSYERFGENAVALYLTARAGQVIGEAELRAALAARLAPFKIPRTIRVLRELPLLPNGKVDRRALSRLAAAEDDEGHD